MDSSAADFVETPSLDRPWGRMGRARLEAWCGRVVALAVGEVVVLRRQGRGRAGVWSAWLRRRVTECVRRGGGWLCCVRREGK
jgi:hypothetical protein